jgi:phosphoribosylamine--glycine ligase
MADDLRAAGRRVVGPGRDGARLEGSKAFMKEVLVAAGVPTARHGTFVDASDAIEFMKSLGGTVVVKTDGLAAGKGVLVTDDLDQAARDVESKLSGAAFGDAGRCVVIEEGLSGKECTLLALVDGSRAVPLGFARDHKRLEDGDRGPNTGGMGAVSPVPDLAAGLVDHVMASAVEPTLAELRARGIEYRGVLYVGLMVDGTSAKVLEYNVRLGDPEAQVVLPRLADDPYDVFEAVATGQLDAAPRLSDDTAVTVVLAAPGYPSAPRTGGVIQGLAPNGQLLEPLEGVVVHHAATRRGPDGRFLTAGGRVLAVTAVAPTLGEARSRCYAGVESVRFEGRQLRHDVAATEATR